MAVIYHRNEQGVFEKVNPGGASTDTTLSQAGKPADAAAVANAINAAVALKVDKVSGKELSTNDFTNEYKAGLDELMASAHNTFSSITELGITSFPTTMKLVSEAMPKNSMIMIDTRRINGTGSEYDTETISDWGNTANGVAIIVKGVSTARVGMMIMYGTTSTTTANIYYGSYAHDANNVNWFNLDDKFVSKITNKSGVDLDTLTTPGFYFVSAADTTTATNLHFPIGINGHMLVMSDGNGRTRQLFMRLGTADSNNYQWYTRTMHVASNAITISKWWIVCGQEKVWNGGTVLGSEINVGSRYGCQSWLVVARLQSTGALASVVIPRAFLTDDPNEYGSWQIADEECWITFSFCYKSDNNVYIKVLSQTNSEYTTLKYVYRIT